MRFNKGDTTSIGWILLAMTAIVTIVTFNRQKARTLPIPIVGLTEGMEGSEGELKESTDSGEFTVSYQKIRATEKRTELDEVKMSLADQNQVFQITSPQATKENKSWVFDSPMNLQFFVGDQPKGSGFTIPLGERSGLEVLNGTWFGKDDLLWKPKSGFLNGSWILKAGWTKDPQGTFSSNGQPVVWHSDQPNASVLQLQAQEMKGVGNFQKIMLRQINMKLRQGTITTSLAEISENVMQFPSPIVFLSTDGIKIQSERGTIEKIQNELNEINLQRLIGLRNSMKFTDKFQSNQGKVLDNTVTLSGNARWSRQIQSSKYDFQAPELVYDIKQGVMTSNGKVIFSSNGASFNAAQMRFQDQSMLWNLVGPINGMFSDGKFAGRSVTGQGTVWMLDGPITVDFEKNGSSASGDSLDSNNTNWSMKGKPIIWSKGKDKVTTSEINKISNVITLPNKIEGTFMDPQGNVFQATCSNGIIQQNELRLASSVKVQGRGWILLADRATISYNDKNQMNRILASGNVELRGNLGEGLGDSLEIDFNVNETRPTIRWKGKIRGLGSAL